MVERAFIAQGSGISPDGSKIILLFQRFNAVPTVDSPSLLTFTIRYPTNGGAGTAEEVLECRRVRAENPVGQNFTKLTCYLGPPANQNQNARG